jgi:phosphoenolpyruvate synthase/pyruvate phosphate dikinase
MKMIKGEYLVKSSNKILKEYKYIKIKNYYDYEKGNCIVIDYMNPDFTILFSKIDLIITSKGSKLSHLAIIAKEYDKKVILCDRIYDKIKLKKGCLRVIEKEAVVYIEI